jgi:hypothetical protein
MTISERIFILSALGERLTGYIQKGELESLFGQMKNQNAWFTEDFVKKSVQSIADNFLTESKLTSFTSNYAIEDSSVSKVVGVIAAGNIPAVSFHDILCVFLSGNKILIKPSSTDAILIQFLIEQLYAIDERSKEFINIGQRLNEVEALIATGSDNTAKHFEYYFSKVPHIIRRNRTSIAVLNGEENRIDLGNLGNDIFSYFGLGCRNVSKIFVPKGYDFVPFFESIEYWNTILLHHKYNNNYDYNKSIYLVNRDKHFDNGFLLLKESQDLVSPLGVIFYEEYDSVASLRETLQNNASKIQATVGNTGKVEKEIPFGAAQIPSLDQFADEVDTMKFLIDIKK